MNVPVVQAFTWFADAMVDHGETFWALFGVDLNAVLEQQPPDTWDTFPIFQMLNNYLRNHGRSSYFRHSCIGTQCLSQENSSFCNFPVL